MNRSAAVFVVYFLFLVARAPAQDVHFLSVPRGYLDGKVSLGPGNSALALTPDPEDPNFVYAAGFFDGAPRIVRLNLTNEARTVVFNAPTTVAVNGLAAPAADLIYISDNWNDHLYVLQDHNPKDGDFDDPGELRELIEPILTHPTWGWTGSACLVVPSGANHLGLPAGTVLFQSEDGETTQGEVLAVVDPVTSPTFQPPGGAYFSGFNYGGGLAIDSQGRLLVASSFFPDPGKVWICEDTSGDGVIGDGESNVLVPQAVSTSDSVGLSGLTIDNADRGYVCVGKGFAGSALTEIRRFSIPADPLHSTTETVTFATLNSPYVSSLILNATAKSFEPNSLDGATMVISASDPFWGNPDYLLTLRAYGSLGVKQWMHY